MRSTYSKVRCFVLGQRGTGSLCLHRKAPAGVVLTGLNELDAARLHYEEAWRHDADDVSLGLVIADIHKRQGRVASARATLEQCLERAARNGEAEFVEIASKALALLGHRG